MKTDYSMLWAKIKQSKLTQGQLAERIGISRTALNLKINNHKQFTQREILEISKVIGIDKKDISKYFLPKTYTIWIQKED